MAKKFTIKRLIERSLNDAISWNNSYLDSISNCTGDPDWDKTIEEHQNLIKQLRDYRKKHYGY